MRSRMWLAGSHRVRSTLAISCWLGAAAASTHTQGSVPRSADSYRPRIPSELILSVRETAGVPRSGEVVRSGVPIPRSLNLRDPNALTIVNAAGTAVPAEFQVLARWDAARNADAPIQWLLVTFAATVPAKGSAIYRVITGGSAGPNPAPGVRVSLSRSGNQITVNTGQATFRLGGDSGALFDDIRLANGARLVSGSALTVRADNTEAAHSTTRRVTVEHAGPLTAIVMIEGAYDLPPVGGGGLGSMRRYVFTAGSPTALVRHVVNWEGARCGLDISKCGGLPNAVRVQQLRDALTLSLGPSLSVTAIGEFYGPTLQARMAAGESVWVRQRLRARRTDSLAFDVSVGGRTASGVKADGAILAVSGTSGAVAVSLNHMHRYEPQALRLLADGRLALNLADDQVWLGNRQGVFATLAVSALPPDPSRPDLDRLLWAPLNRPLRAWPEPAWFAASDAVDEFPVGSLPTDLSGYDTLVKSSLEGTLQKVDEKGLAGLMTFGLYPRYWASSPGDELDCSGDPTDPGETWDNLYWCATWTDYHNTVVTAPIWAMRSGEVEWLDETGFPGALRMLHTQIVQCTPGDTFNRCGTAPAGYGGYRGNFNSSHQYWDNLFLYYWLTGDYTVVETVKRGAGITRTWYCTRRPAQSCSPDDPPLDWAGPTGRVASQWFAAFRFVGLASDDGSFLEDYKSGLARAVTQYYVEAEQAGTRYGFWLIDRVAGPGRSTTDQLWMASLYDMNLLYRLQRDTSDAPIGNPPLRPSQVLAAWARTLVRFGPTAAPGADGTARGPWSNQLTLTWSGNRIGGRLQSVGHTPSDEAFLYDTGKATLTAGIVRAGRQIGAAEIERMGRDLVQLTIASALATRAPLGKLQGEYLSRLHTAVALLAPMPTNPAFCLDVSVTGSGTVTGPGLSSGPGGSRICAAGEVVNLTAAPASGWVFAGWSGDADCSDGAVTLRANRVCRATFVAVLGRAPPRGTVDLNGDGGADVFRYNAATGAWAMELGDREGRFGSQSGNWDPGWSVSAADFTGDGLTDLFLYNPVTGAWVKATNTGHGTFDYFSAPIRWSPGWNIYAADLDGDRLSDLFLYNPRTGIWFKCFNRGPRGFIYVRGSWSPDWGVHPADQNGDGRADLFLYNAATGQWFWAINDGGAGFGYHTGFWSPAWTIAPGDFSGDGRSDLFLYNETTGRFLVATNIGLDFSYLNGVWSSGWRVHVADFDGNDVTDVFLYNPATGRWFEVVTSSPGRFTYFGGTWDPGWQVSVTDFNADGRSDALLYSPVTGRWFQCFNFTLGTFTYGTGVWEPGLSLVATSIRIP